LLDTFIMICIDVANQSICSCFFAWHMVT